MRTRRIIAGLVGAAVALAACAGEGGESPATAPASSPDTAAEASSSSTAATSVEAPSVATTASSFGDVQACADVIDGNIRALGGGEFSIDATVRSGDTGWDKYADSWEIRTTDETTIDVRVLTHPHETEQPFTRSLSPVMIPDDVDQIVLMASDSVNGFCGDAVTLDVPR